MITEQEIIRHEGSMCTHMFQFQGDLNLHVFMNLLIKLRDQLLLVRLVQHVQHAAAIYTHLADNATLENVAQQHY